MDELRAELRAKGLGRLEETIVGLARNAISVQLHPTQEEQPLGTSRFGGHPDLPAGTPWPFAGGKPLRFIAQLNLADLAPHDVESRLPAEGLLSVFLNVDDVYELTLETGAKVLLVNPLLGSLSRQGPPVQHEAPVRKSLLRKLIDSWWNVEPTPAPDIPVSTMTFRPYLAVPGWEHPAVDALNLNEEDQEAYCDFQQSYLLGDEARLAELSLLGYPVPIQGDPVGLFADGSPPVPDAIQLLALSCDFIYGRPSEGEYYLLVSEGALKRGDLSRVGCEFQFD